MQNFIKCMVEVFAYEYIKKIIFSIGKLALTSWYYKEKFFFSLDRFEYNIYLKENWVMCFIK